MTDERVRLETAKGDRALSAARLLLQADLADEAVTRAYYAAFHYVRALLVREGLDAKTHEGVAHLLNLHFVRTARLDPAIARTLRDLEGRREDADYDAAAVFTGAMAEEAVAAATTVAAAVRALLNPPS